MNICSNCYSLMTPLATYVERNRKWEPSQPSYILCCDCPSPIEVEDGEIENYEENWQSLDLDDLTEKEETILGYLAKEERIDYVSTEILERQSTDSVVRDKQIWLDIL